MIYNKIYKGPKIGPRHFKKTFNNDKEHDTVSLCDKNYFHKYLSKVKFYSFMINCSVFLNFFLI